MTTPHARPRITLASLEPAQQLLAPATELAIYAYLTHVYHLYDWGHAFAKLLVFSALAATIAYVAKRRSEEHGQPLLY